MTDAPRDFRVVIDCDRCKRTHWAAGTCPACDAPAPLRPAPPAEARDDARESPAVRSIRKGRP